MPNDEILAKEVPEIDIILGGHDHDNNIKNLNGKFHSFFFYSTLRTAVARAFADSLVIISKMT